MERVVRHFQEELEALKERLLAMGGLAEERVRVSVQALTERDASAVQAILTGDEPRHGVGVAPLGLGVEVGEAKVTLNVPTVPSTLAPLVATSVWFGLLASRGTSAS